MNARCWRACVAWIVAAGIVVRVRQYAANTSLWHDESYVALNILHTPAAALLGPLDWHEPSPPGFLVAEKLIVAALGKSEYALRLLPLLIGIAALCAFAALARRLCSDGAAAAWAVGFMALSPKMIEHCNQVKHFTFDVLASILLMGVAWRAWHAPPATRLILQWGAMAAILPWLSYASVFMVASTGLMLAVRAFTQWSVSARRAFIIANSVVLASWAVLTVAALRQRTSGVTAHWRAAFPDLDGPLSLMVWVARGLVGLASHFWQPLGALLILCVALASTAAWMERRRALLVTCWLPVAMTMAASFLQWWPFGGNQHMVFVTPALFVLAGEGAEIARTSLARWYPRPATALVLLLFLPCAGAVLFHLLVPRTRHELRPVIRYAQAHSAADDATVVFDHATYAYYTGQDRRGVAADTGAAPRVWIITPRRSSGALETDVQQLIDDLCRRRERIDAVETPGAAAYLFGRVRGS